jgi:hypothetical protein
MRKQVHRFVQGLRHQHPIKWISMVDMEFFNKFISLLPDN